MDQIKLQNIITNLNFIVKTVINFLKRKSNGIHYSIFNFIYFYRFTKRWIHMIKRRYWHQSIIVELRMAKGLTQSDLAELCDISVTTVGNIEAGITAGNFMTVDKIFNALGHEIEVIQIEDGEKTESTRYH